MATFCATGAAVLPALAPLAAHAQSSVTLYGTVDNAIAWSNSQTALGSNANGRHNVQMAPGTWDGSKFGFQGREDLGDGWAAIFNLMSRFNSANGNAQYSGAMFGQQAWVGMTNARYGSLTLGRQLTSYYWMVAPWSPTNWLTGFSGAHPGDLDNFDTIYKTSNTALYKSPSFYGLTVSGAYALGGQPGSLAQGSSWSAGLQYRLGAFGVGAGIERFNNATPGGGAWDPNSTASQAGEIGVSAVTNGYRTAAAQQRIAVTGGYAITSNVDVSASYSNVQYVPGAGSAFRSTEVWNTFGAVLHVRLAAVWDLAAGYSYTRASQANGITSGAQYQQGSLAEYYSLSKQTGLYFLQAYQRANGQTLGTDGVSIINATPTIGDGFNGSPSSSRSMVTVAAGLIHRF
ncbi:porin [Paraburkholderia acidisoli]|uniref:Porin n=1 Tax=Paraburkholderia acidisoli TaxID=2571748 RepID=A0A7Z2GK48_9BURK|nr:porin [Paraburkholderia acidisoli]QGZ62950.1 porin [Paraburkholderia acidisoli]